MDDELKQKWVAALRSGQYKQAQGALKRNGGYCCLGVYCEVAGIAIEDNGVYVVGYCDGYTPINSALGHTLTTDCINMNDTMSYSFDDIADFVEGKHSYDWYKTCWEENHPGASIGPPEAKFEAGIQKC